MGYRNVVVGTDGSETAADAVRHAAELAKAFGARLTVVTAYVPTPGARRRRRRARGDALDGHRRRPGPRSGPERARRWRPRSALADVRTRVGEGDPAEMLIEAAEDTGGDSSSWARRAWRRPPASCWAACPTGSPTTRRATSSSSTRSDCDRPISSPVRLGELTG